MEELRKGRKRCKEEERWKQKNDRDGRAERSKRESMVEGKERGHRKGGRRVR